MTLEQAIDRYTNNAEYERTHGSLHGCLEFKQLAEWLKDYKRLLEQQSREDCISRQAVLDGLKGCMCEDWVKTLFATMVKQLPSVTQKSGKWILLDECTNSGYYCSNCQKKLVKEGWSQTVKKIKYCPNCGAKMQESEDKE